MKTIWKNLIGAGAIVAVTTLVNTQVVSQEEQSSEQEMFEAWMKLAAPGPEHAQLAKLAGEWKQSTTHWMAPGAPPQVSDGTATFEPILGGRFMLERMHSTIDLMGEPFEYEAMGIIGYDRMRQKHFYAWLDNMGTLMMVGEGAANMQGNEITYESELPNPMGGTIKMKSVSRIVNDNETVFEIHQQQPDGTWFRQMEMISDRVQK